MAKEKLSFRTSKDSGGAGKTSMVFLALFVIVTLAFLWYFLQYQKAEKEINFLATPEGRQELDRKEIEKVVESVGKLMVLPENETPTVATIEDAETLAKDQPFFANSSNGDKVLIYTSKAIIYNPEKNILVNVGPVYFQGNEAGNVPPEQVVPEPEPEPEPEPVTLIDLDIRNGSQTQGRAQTLADNLLSEGDYNVVNLGAATRDDYTGMTLVNLGGVDASALEARLGVTAISSLPEDEAGSNASLVIIIGN